jgi:CheY-like chemotaxis protein
MIKKILLVEDSPEALTNLKDLITMEGYEVITATNGHEGIDKIYLYHPDLIITDLRMPKMDGYAFLEKIRKTDGGNPVPIIVFSANATPENERKSLELGADLFLKKPCPTEGLLNAIQKLLT